MKQELSEYEKKLYRYSGLWLYLLFLIYGYLHFLITQPEIAFVPGNSNFKIDFLFLCIGLLICRFLYDFIAQYINVKNNHLKVFVIAICVALLSVIINTAISTIMYSISFNDFIEQVPILFLLFRTMLEAVSYVIIFKLLDKYHTKFFQETTKEKQVENKSISYTFAVMACFFGLIAVVNVIPKWNFWNGRNTDNALFFTISAPLFFANLLCLIISLWTSFKRSWCSFLVFYTIAVAVLSISRLPWTSNSDVDNYFWFYVSMDNIGKMMLSPIGIMIAFAIICFHTLVSTAVSEFVYDKLKQKQEK